MGGPCASPETSEPAFRPLEPLAEAPSPGDEAPCCCGGKPAPPSSPLERPGYQLWPFVADMLETPVGPAPVVKTRLEREDRLGALRVRCTVNRSVYRVAPGLYAVGAPDERSPVLVSANYKLSFDALRQELDGLDAWILVLDTRGVNVWCAAGKKTFSTGELIRRVRLCGLERVVAHRELVVPQLGAPGVSGPEVKRGCGFAVVWGPVRAADLKAFLAAGKEAAPGMRAVTFRLRERLTLIPVELLLCRTFAFWALPLVFLLSGLGPDVFSLGEAWRRAGPALLACVLGLASGAGLAPALLPWLPGRSFWLKGAQTGLAAGLPAVALSWSGLRGLEALALLLLSAAASSYACMNFTGATPFASPSGVEKEMRRGIPLQAAALLGAALLWIGANFLGRS